MENETRHDHKNPLGLTLYVAGWSIVAIVVAGAVLWGMTIALDRIDLPRYQPPKSGAEKPLGEALEETTPSSETAPDLLSQTQMESESSAAHEGETPMDGSAGTVMPAEPEMGEATAPVDDSQAAALQVPAAAGTVTSAEPPGDQAPVEPAPGIHARPAVPMGTVHAPETKAEEVQPVGVALVEAIIEPLEYELKERFWGWRPNDVINITDNVNNFQLGVLEVTRRAVVQLARRISRTGSTDSFDPNLENAMSWIMTKATDYWFPSPETKYTESLDELKTYKTNLINGEAYFYTRADNFIPLFEVFEDLLGSCDQNLVKQKEADGTTVSTFKADDYFYYAKGVAHAMAIILEGVQIDFATTLDNRRSSELLHDAIESCQRAAQIEPWIVTDADPDGILANHRANMAAPISHARYYLGQLVIALST